MESEYIYAIWLIYTYVWQKQNILSAFTAQSRNGDHNQGILALDDVHKLD